MKKVQPKIQFPKTVLLSLFWEDFDKLKVMLKSAIIAKGQKHLLISHVKLCDIVQNEQLCHSFYTLDMNVELELRRLALQEDSCEYIILTVK